MLYTMGGEGGCRLGWDGCCYTVGAVLNVEGSTYCFLFAADIGQLCCFNAVTRAVSNPECLYLARLASLFLRGNQLVFSPCKRVDLMPQLVAGILLIAQV